MELLELAVQVAGKLGVVSAEFVGAVFFLFGGYKLYDGNKGSTDSLGQVFHLAGFLGMLFGGFTLVAMLCTLFTV